jgi:ribonucleoside-diphosphate reductase alpha chain
MDAQSIPSEGGQATLFPDKSTLSFDLFFNKHGHPFDSVKWGQRDAVIKNAKGEIVFEQKNVEAPESWSDRAINIVAEKYFRVVDGVKENSVKQLITRVAHTIAVAGRVQGLLDTATSLVFEQELSYLLLHQMFAFNSPVWFNIGVPGVPQQASACFINAVEDTMESITDLGKTEIMLFKGGSGAGSNLSKLRSSYERLSGGGVPSGPVSFMKWLDSGAGVTKSGGTTRRAALMRTLNIDHPDILELANGEAGFITCKAHAETIAQALINGGFSPEFNKAGNAYDLVPFQNANNSVRVTDTFMQKVLDDKEFNTISRTTGKTVSTYKARDLWEKIAEAAWASGDPGIQFDTSTNDWHTLPNTGRINASNPCSEFLHLDDTSCNLGSFNLMKFQSEHGFHVKPFAVATEICITAMEILCGYSVYPSESITKHTKASRPLGIGYANLGTLLMTEGLAYDSNEGRALAAGITSLMSAVAYRQSARMAQVLGPFEYYSANSFPMQQVIAKHQDAAGQLAPAVTASAAKQVWQQAADLGKAYGFRNSQVSVLAPTGTIAFMMDCDTNGIEPNLALTQYKKLVGGGFVKIPTRAVPQALSKLGYNGTAKDVLDTIEKTGALPENMDPAHKRVFQTAIGDDQITTEGHLMMMGAVQPFLSGGISKTVNMAKTATVGDVANAFMRAWQLGLKCVTVYRDGCKASQPASAKAEAKTVDKSEDKHATLGPVWGERKRLPDERPSVTHKFSVGGQDGYFHIGLNADGSPGEVFINISKAGSTLHGLVDMAATAISLGLQYGVPLHTLLEKFKGVRFEPSGFTGNTLIPRADSLGDYFARWMELRFSGEPTDPSTVFVNQQPVVAKAAGVSYHGAPCSSCGNITVRAGTCWVCNTCGTTTGCG